MPALSPTMEEGTLAKWHVKAGDTVKSGDVIAEIETDKATMEVEAVDEGVVTEILIAEGSEGVKVNTPIARLQGEGETAAPAPAAAPAPRQVQSLEQMGIAPGSYDLVPLDGMRKTVARRLTDSFRDVPHFPLTIDIEIDNLLAARAKINAMLEKQGGKVSVNDLVMKA